MHNREGGGIDRQTDRQRHIIRQSEREREREGGVGGLAEEYKSNKDQGNKMMYSD